MAVAWPTTDKGRPYYHIHHLQQDVTYVHRVSVEVYSSQLALLSGTHKREVVCHNIVRDCEVYKSVIISSNNGAQMTVVVTLLRSIHC